MHQVASGEFEGHTLESKNLNVEPYEMVLFRGNVTC